MNMLHATLHKEMMITLSNLTSSFFSSRLITFSHSPFETASSISFTMIGLNREVGWGVPLCRLGWRAGLSGGGLECGRGEVYLRGVGERG